MRRTRSVPAAVVLTAVICLAAEPASAQTREAGDSVERAQQGEVRGDQAAPRPSLRRRPAPRPAPSGEERERAPQRNEDEEASRSSLRQEARRAG